MQKFTQCFLPRFIQQKYQQNNFQGKFNGSSLFVDINDFTGKTEKLFKQGDQGAEEISQFLVKVFDLPIKATYLNQGFISGFSGDAFLAIFPDDDGKRADKTIEIIGSSFAGNKELGNSIKIKTGCGNMEWGIVGNQQYRTYYFSGPGIDQAINSGIEDLTRYSKSPYPDDIFSNLQVQTCSPESARDFFNYSIIKHHIQPELRYVIPVFANFGKQSGFNYINELVLKNFQIAQSNQGFFNKVEVGDKGVVTLTVFGAPQSKEYSEVLAIGFAKQIRSHFPQVKIGIDFGLAYTGLTGNYFRNEWTVIGDVVNCAFRLMSSANQGEILLSERFKNKSQNLFMLTDIGETVLKGKTHPEKIYKFEKENKLKHEDYLSPFLGRDGEIGKIKTFLDNRFKSTGAGLIHLWGEAGIGKTRLVRELISREISSPLDWIVLKADQSLNYPWNPLHTWLKEILGIQDESQPEVKKNILSFLNKLSSWYQSYWSYLAAVCGYRWDNTVYEQVDEKTRIDNQNFILTEILNYICLQQSTLMVIDDYHWADDLTRSWLENIIENPKFENVSLNLILITQQQSLDFFIPSESTHIQLKVAGLKSEEIEQLIQILLKRKLQQEALNSLVNRIQGNPFFAEQLILSIQNSNLKIELEHSRLPSTLSEILTARIDRLKPDTRELIKTCSILGNSFSSNLLSNLIQWERNKLETVTYDAIDQGVLRLMENRYLTFSQNLLQQAAYQLLLPSDRINLHTSVVDIIENSDQFSMEKNIGLLYEQAKKAKLIHKWIKYARIYGEFLKQHYAHRDAIRVYGELTLYYRSQAMQIKHIQTEYSIAKIYLHIGKFDQARDILENLQASFPEIKSKKIAVKILNSLGETYFRLSDYRTAENLINQSIHLCLENTYTDELINTQILLAVVLQSKNEINQAISIYQKLLPLINQHDRGELSIKTWLNLSGLYILTRKYDLAQRYLQKCLNNPEIENNLLNLVMAHTNMGIIEINSGNIQQALVHFKNTLSITEKIGSLPNQAAAKHNIGKLYLDLGDKTLAEKYFQESLEMHRVMSIKHGELQSLISLGVVHEDNLEKAQLYYQQAKQIAEQYGYQKEQLMIEANIADAYHLAGLEDQALKKLKSALKLAEQNKMENFVEIIQDKIDKLNHS